MICLAVGGAWSAEDETQRVIEDKYKAIENKTVFWLYRTLPDATFEMDDLWAIVRMWTYEAITKYDVTRGAKFTSFLMNYLKYYSLKLQHLHWRPSNKPKEGFVICESQMPQADGFFTIDRVCERSDDKVHNGIKQANRQSPVESQVMFEPDHSSDLRITEFRAALPESANRCFAALLDYEDQATLLKAFRSSRWKRRVSELTGLSKEIVAELREQVVTRAEMYI